MENYAPVRKRSILGMIWRFIMTLFAIFSIIIVLMLIAGLYFASAGADTYIEEVITAGSHNEKIAIINLDGIIAAESFKSFKKQIKMAKKDQNVRAIIIRVNSPGGAVSESDNIHHLITQYKSNTYNPALCFMDGLAASGGYYSAVACDKIIASPTTITGSIGVIMGHFDLSGFLTEKLNITQTTLKSGEKKDWPSIFRALSQQEQDYLFEKVINPAYKRFVGLVEKGRPNLTAEQVKQLADGGVFFADEALDKGLIDDIGYIESAIASAVEMAKLENPTVVEYKKPFSFSELMSSQSKSNLFNVEQIKQLSCPDLMYLWTGQN